MNNPTDATGPQEAAEASSCPPWCTEQPAEPHVHQGEPVDIAYFVDGKNVSIYSVSLAQRADSQSPVVAIIAEDGDPALLPLDEARTLADALADREGCSARALALALETLLERCAVTGANRELTEAEVQDLYAFYDQVRTQGGREATATLLELTRVCGDRVEGWRELLAFSVPALMAGDWRAVRARLDTAST
jgi:hypothetical protein